MKNANLPYGRENEKNTGRDGEDDSGDVTER